MNGMVRAEPDPGVLRMKELAIGGKKVTWANLFAVNDRESMVAAMEKLVPYMTDDTTTVGILNNRADRERRAIQFADVAAFDLSFDRLVTFGAYEGLVTDRLRTNGYPAEHIVNLGDEHHPTRDQIIQRMIVDQPTSHVLVVGFVNIHTHQAEEMLEYFEHEAQPWGLASVDDDDMGDIGGFGDGDEPEHGFRPVHRESRHAVELAGPPGPRPPSIRHISV